MDMQLRLTDKIYESIKDDIIAGKLKGNTFLAESEIAAKYQVSKAPVKAALQMLVQEGFVICFPRRGYMITTVSVQEFYYVREVRIHLEQLSIKLAVERASEEEIDSLKQVLDSEDNRISTYKSNNMRFHMRLAEIARNPYLAEALQKLLAITARFAIAHREDNKYHLQIIEALHNRNFDTALKSLHQDLNAN